jgi:hypothetical protein
MKTIIKYISLLLFSGLILPFYNSKHKKTGSKQCQNHVSPVIESHRAQKSGKMRIQYFIYQDIAEMLLPRANKLKIICNLLPYLTSYYKITITCLPVPAYHINPVPMKTSTLYNII